MTLEGTKRDFHDLHERRAYERAVELANALLERPDLLKVGERFLDRFVAPDRRQAHAYRAWTALLRRPPVEVAQALVEDSDQGQFLRDTAPSFRVVSAEEAEATRRLFP